MRERLGNETKGENVFFDNMTINHYTGPLTETTDYNPWGLTMKMLSSKAFGKIENKYKHNGYEQNETFDLNLYESFYRTHDPQLGRFWQVDPKPTDFESLYAAMGNNPIAYNDILGDSIPFRFLDQNNNLFANFQKEVPALIQKMFNEEYGVTVGYNSETGMLYMTGNFETTNKISPTARKKIIKALTDTRSGKKAKKKYGVIYVGHKGMKSDVGEDVDPALTSKRVIRTGGEDVYINLDAYNDDLTPKGYDFSGLTKFGYSPRAYNLARHFEHEWFGHSVGGRRFDGNHRKPGKVEYWPNLFREEMGLPIRLNYGAVTPGGNTAIIFGERGSDVNKLLKLLYESKGEAVPHVLIRIVR
jgi:RHS repeat-associated protein